MNIENLLDPYGGDGQDKTINSGLMGILGIATDMFSDSFDKYYFRPIRKHYARGIRNHKADYVAKKLGIDELLGGSARVNNYSNKKMERELRAKGIKTKPAKVDIASKFHESKYYAEGGPAMRKAAYGRYKNMKSQMIKSKGFIKAAAWTFAIAGLVDLGESLFTPGINKVAARKDQEMFLDESPMDSSRLATARLRALQAISDSSMQVRHVLGNEASLLAQ